MVKVLGIELNDSNLDSAVKKIVSEVSKKKKKNLCISATGAHGLVTAKKDRKFRKILESFYLNLPDGQPAVWVGRLKGAKKMERCYGPDFFKDVTVLSANKDIKHFFCGGKPGVASELKTACARKFGNKNIVGTFCPPFREMTDAELKRLAEKINKSQADIVWIGLGTPKQEFFAHRLSKFTKVHFIVTVGAAFDFHTGKVKQAPKFMQRAGLEWFFRLCVEPRRLYRRYLEVVPKFIYYSIIDLAKK